MKSKSRVNNSVAATSEAATTGTPATVGEQVNHRENMMQRHSIYDAYYDSDCDDFGDNRFAVISDSDNIREVEPVNMHVGFRNTEKEKH